MTSCLESPIELISAGESIRLPAIEGYFTLLPDHPGEGWYKIGGGQLHMEWNENSKSLFFDVEPRNPELPKGIRASDILFKTLRVLPLDQARQIYLVQMMDPRFDKNLEFWTDVNSSPETKEKYRISFGKTKDVFDQWVERELSTKPNHRIVLIRIDEHGVVRMGGDESWFKAIKGFSIALESGDSKAALQLLKDNVTNLTNQFFKERVLVPVKPTRPKKSKKSIQP